MRLTLTLGSLPLTLLAYGQVNFPFPDSAATWVQYYEVMVSPPPIPVFNWQTTANFCMDGSDTLLAGQVYTQLAYCGDSYVGGIRSDSGAVYFFPADSLQEYLLYDFAVNVGDTLRNVFVNEELGVGTAGWMNSGTVDLEVIDVAPNSNYDGRISVTVATTDGTGTLTEWIEGIGCYHGLFTLNPINISGYWYGLDCMTYLDTTYWNGFYTNTPGTCTPQYVGIADPEADSAIDLYPNPTADLTTISLTEGTIDRAWLTDLSGRVLPITLPRGTTRMQVDLSTLHDGIYLLRLQQGTRTVTRRLVKVGGN
ncbi:MAG: T9SS type A sorting domain-containing protein [Flavobacteriales bacterium]